MEIVPNIGFGALRFGISPAEAKAIISEKQTYEDWMGGNLNDSLLYHHLIIGFDKYDGDGPLPDAGLSEIRLRCHEDITLWGRCVSDWTEGDIIGHLHRQRIVYEKFANGDLFVPALSLSLSFDESDRINFVEMWASRDVPIKRLQLTAR